MNENLALALNDFAHDTKKFTVIFMLFKINWNYKKEHRIKRNSTDSRKKQSRFLAIKIQEQWSCQSVR